MTFYRKNYYAAKPLIKQDNLKSRLEKIQKEKLDVRTKEFVDSLSEYFKMKGGLSENQLNYFQKIESRYSPQEREKIKEWEQEYNENHLNDSRIIAVYYQEAGYYTSTAQSILENKSYVPSKKVFKKMMGNKYAQKVLENHKAEPRFLKGQKVQLRSQAGTHTIDSHLRGLRNRLCYVIGINLPVKNPFKGGKRYSLLPMGETNLIEADERNLMKPNKKGRNL
tara:strand:- start:1504 stop:2172 length:669 start_codon:yes stop_codon:yes gene_type:complete